MGASPQRPHISVVADGDVTQAFCEAAVLRGRVAWDIETTGLDWEHDSIEVCQVYVPEFGIEVVSHPSKAPRRLCALLSDKRVSKVFHHAMFDVRFMRHAWGCKPASIICTKVLAKVLKPSQESHHLQDLLQAELGVSISKDLAQSDWSQTHLTQEQIEYAANDVAYLPRLAIKLEEGLSEAGLLELALSCCEHIPTRVELEVRRLGDVFTY